MKVFSVFLVTLLSSLTVFSQTITEVLMPQYVQGAGTFSPDDDRKTPFACRLRIDGLTPNATYRYYTGFVDDPSTTTSEGYFIQPDAAAFKRVTSPSLAISGRYGEFTANGTGSYTGWFMAEVNKAGIFYPYVGSFVYFRLSINNGTGGVSVFRGLTSPSQITTIGFGSTADDATALRSTAAASGVARNFVMLWDETAARPIAGTVIESDGLVNGTANGFADFYATQVDGKDKTWGTIVPNNLSGGIRKIVQYSFADGSEIGNKTSTDGNWAKAGGGTVSTVNVTGGLSGVVVLDGTIITLGVAAQQPQTITFNALPAKIYGEADLDPGATASSLLSVTYTSSNPAVATIVNGNAIHITGAGTTDIKAEQAGNTDYSAATPVVQTLTVSKANLTITADNKVKVEGDPIPALTVSYSGFVNGDEAADLTTLPVIATTALSASPAGEYPITASGAVSGNYNLAYVAGKLTVTSNKQPQTITFGALTAKIYGAADFDPGATASSRLTITYQSSDAAVAAIVNGKIHITGTGTATITASQAGDVNYEAATPADQLLTVNKAPLTIKADDKAKLTGQANPALTITYTGFVNNETNTVLTAQPVVATTAVVNSPSGGYPITVSGAAAANYTITYMNGTLTVSPLPAQTITFNALPVKKYGDAAFDAGGVATSGLPVSYTSSNANVATVVNGKIQVTGAGTAVITASQAGDATHAPAAEVARTLTVQKVNLLIKALDTSKTEGEANPPLLITYSGFLNGDDAGKLSTPPVVSTIATAGSLAGKYPIIITGAASNNYAIAQLNGTLTVLPPQGANQDYLAAYMSSPGQIQVNLHAVETGKTVIQLFDQYGTRLQQVNVTANKGFNTYHLSVGNIIAGIYHIRVAGPGFVLKTKVAVK